MGLPQTTPPCQGSAASIQISHSSIDTSGLNNVTLVTPTLLFYNSYTGPATWLCCTDMKWCEPLKTFLCSRRRMLNVDLIRRHQVAYYHLNAADTTFDLLSDLLTWFHHISTQPGWRSISHVLKHAQKATATAKILLQFPSTAAFPAKPGSALPPWVLLFHQLIMIIIEILCQLSTWCNSTMAYLFQPVGFDAMGILWDTLSLKHPDR